MSEPDNSTIDLSSLVAMITEGVLAHVSPSQGGVAPSGGGGDPSAGETGSGLGGGTGSPGAELSGSVTEGRRITWVFAAPCAHLALVCGELAVLARLGHRQRVVACLDVVDCLRRAACWPGEGADLTLHGLESGGRGLSSLLASLADQEAIYLGSVGWAQARALAELRDEDAFVSLLISGLTAGKKVWLPCGPGMGGLQGLVLQERSTAAPALLSQARRLWRALESLGVGPLPLGELRRPLAALEVERSPAHGALGGLLTEADVDDAAAAGLRELRISRGTLVTPLARDRSRALGVSIEQV